jgi:hypothetical protein
LFPGSPCRPVLRQQQASAVIGARQRIVEGAVGMVRALTEAGRLPAEAGHMRPPCRPPRSADPGAA